MVDALVIAGSTDLTPSIDEISAVIEVLPDVVICGCSDGADKAGFAWARAHKIPVEFFPAWLKQRDWALSVRMDREIVHPLPRISNRGAGPVRNAEMAFHATRAILFWNGESPGTRNMRDCCLRKGINCEVHA